MIQGIRQLLKTIPGNKTLTSKYLSITVLSTYQKDIDHLKLNAHRSSFIIPNLNKALKTRVNDSDILFLEVISELCFVKYYGRCLLLLLRISSAHLGSEMLNFLKEFAY